MSGDCWASEGVAERHTNVLVRTLAPIAALLLGACGAPTLGPATPGPSRVHEPPSAVVANVIAVHGFNDHKGAFEAFGAHAAKCGIRVEAYDQQGFGETANHGRWAGQDVLVEDLRERIREHHTKWPGTPLFVLGESMGAAVTIAALSASPPLPVTGAILVAPAVWGGEALNPFYRAALWVAARVAPGLEVTGRSLGRRASDNDEMLIALGRDPLFIKSTRIDAVEGLVGLMTDARAMGIDLTAPRLVLAGAHDEIIPPEAITTFVEQMRPQGLEYRFYANGWHMLFRDRQGEIVRRDTIGWIRQYSTEGQADEAECRASGPVSQH